MRRSCMSYNNRLQNGSVVEFDVGRTACKPFGFYAGEQVTTSRIKGPATGMYDEM